MKNSSNDITIKCDYCEKPAVRNYQRIWVSWKVYQKDGSYSKNPRLELDVEEPTGENNYHLCEEHEEQFLNGDI